MRSKKFPLRQAVIIVEKAKLKRKDKVLEGKRSSETGKMSLRGGYYNSPVRVFNGIYIPKESLKSFSMASCPASLR
jgi:hypothetical protein